MSGESMKRYDVYSRFARRHLKTREERAVYLTLVGQEADSWSVGELARRTRLHPSETERVLKEFEAGGVVEAVGATEGRRYRWRSDLGYLLGEEAEDADQLDPVCGMPVLAETPLVAEDLQHRRRRFCSSVCLETFLASPPIHRPPAAISRAVV